MKKMHLFFIGSIILSYLESFNQESSHEKSKGISLNYISGRDLDISPAYFFTNNKYRIDIGPIIGFDNKKSEEWSQKPQQINTGLLLSYRYFPNNDHNKFDLYFGTKLESYYHYSVTKNVYEWHHGFHQFVTKKNKEYANTIYLNFGFIYNISPKLHFMADINGGLN